MVSSILIKEPGCQTRSRLTEKLKNVEKRSNTRRKPNGYAFGNGITKMYFSEHLVGVNLVVINYKIRDNKNLPVTRPARYSLMWPRALVNHNQLMNITTYSTQDL